MKLNEQPNAFVITLSATSRLSEQGKKNAEIGERFLDRLKKSLLSNNWKFELFPAQDGHLLTLNHWDNINVSVPAKTKMSSGALGCFYSHFLLWQKCIEFNQPIVILEHDAIIQQQWPKDFEISNEVIKICYMFTNKRTSKITGNWIAGTYGYVIDPAAAKSLITAARTHGAMPSDKIIGDCIVNWRFSYPRLGTLFIPSLHQSSTNYRFKQN